MIKKGFMEKPASIYSINPLGNQVIVFKVTALLEFRGSDSFSLRTKQAVRHPWTRGRVNKNKLGKLTPIEADADEAPNPGVLALLAHLMAEGKYAAFLRLFSPRLQEEIRQGEREALEHELVLQKWDELIAEQRQKDVAGQ